MRGADILIQALSNAGVQRMFSLSGNQIMPVYDAAIGSGIDILHVRHEAAAVHMADAWGRLTEQPGIALVTAGPGFANAISALYTAQISESPMVLMSGHAPLKLLGKGAFQEMPQAAMAAPVVKASWTAEDPATLDQDIARAFQIATSGRPGPVYIALPNDVLDGKTDRASGALPPSDEGPKASDADLDRVLSMLTAAKRPIVIAGPALMRGPRGQAVKLLEREIGAPVVGMESPRGINDPSLGTFSEVLAQADLIVLLGKKLDYTLRMGASPVISASCKLIQIDADGHVLDQTRHVIGDSARLAAAIQGEPAAAARRMAELGGKQQRLASGWLGEVSGIPSIRSIAFSDDSRQMAIAFSSGHLQLWDLQKFRPVSTIENCSASRVTFGSDHSVIAAGLGHVRVYRDNLKSEETIAADGMGDPMWLGLSGDGGTLAAFVDEERDVWVFDLDGMMLKHKLPGPQG